MVPNNSKSIENNNNIYKKKPNVGHAALKGWSLVFYGTKQAVDKNDVVSVPLLPLNTLSTSTNQPIINTTKSTIAKGNRKQPQKTNQTNPPNGRKNSKINGKNESRKNWKQRLTTVRPYTTGRDRKYDNINGYAFMNKTLTSTITTTMRPIKLPSNNVDPKNTDKLVYVKAPIKAPKQIKEIAAGSNKPNTTIVPILHAPFVHETKKLNDSTPFHPTTISSFDAKVDIIDGIPYTSNPNFPKFFQRYEKIQEIYPEFHPYVVPKVLSSGSAMKPSRDGSKNTHFALTSNQQTSSAEDSHLSMDGPPSRIQSSTVITSKNGKG